MAVADKTGRRRRGAMLNAHYFEFLIPSDIIIFGLTSYAGVRGRQKAAILAAAVAGGAEAAARVAIHLGNGRRGHLLHLGRLLVRRPTHSAH